MLPHIFLHLSIFACLVAADKTCYYPKGNIAVDDVPCFSGDKDSPCCSKDSICLSNGLCYGKAQPFVLSRGSCTNKDWPVEGGCDDKCSKGNMLDKGCALPLYRIEDKKSEYCANSIIVDASNKLACSAGSPFTLDPAEFLWGKAALANYTSGDASSNSTSTSNTTACPTTSSSGNKECNDNKDGKGNNDIAIGAGVGIPLGVLLLTALCWALFERRKRLSVQATVAGLQSQSAMTHRDLQGQTSAYAPPSELSAQKPPQELATTST
ncbi:hypothetical protein N7517_005070 [Penicillium concentricum]|uniref:Disintegrin domain-containing protein n=1 Tax=Penicillium concentricum TaxID=293559 RepID=A0A9W9S8S7_9EURO|nr:uncharacterized protein N7517_005070 [Penicillium concentricum]KAJ5373064.1 hypothetical protein N7517_005070 [Penicillium concentricum]